MREDPIVAEVRKVRELHSKQFGNNLDSIIADLKQKEDSEDWPKVCIESEKQTGDVVSKSIPKVL